MLRSRAATTLALAAVLALSGCFTYQSAPVDELTPESRVRVHLTRQGYASLPGTIEASGPRLSGNVVGVFGDELFLRVPLPSPGPGVNVELGQQVVIPVVDVERLERREVSRSRSILLAAAGLAGAVGLYLTFEKGNPIQPQDREQPEVEEGLRASTFLRFGFPLP